MKDMTARCGGEVNHTSTALLLIENKNLSTSCRDLLATTDLTSSMDITQNIYYRTLYKII